MLKFFVLLCVVTAAFVYANPSIKQEGPTPVTFVNLVRSRPHRPVAGKFAASGYLIRASGSSCNAAKHRYPCDGSCFGMDVSYLTWEVSGFNNSDHQVVTDYFSSEACDDDYIGSTYGNADQCYGTKDANAALAKTFSCSVVSRSHTS